MSLLDTIALRSFRLQKVAGIHLSLEGTGSMRLSHVVLKKAKGEIIREQAAEQGSFEALGEQLGTGTPLTISIGGKGVLVKKLSGNSAADPLDEVLPQANKEEFYYTLYEGESHRFIAVARKDLVDRVLSAFKSRNFKLASVQLGFFSATVLIPLLHEPSSIFLQDMVLDTDGNSLQAFRPAEVSGLNKIGDESLAPSLALPYANALQLMLEEEESVATNLGLKAEWLQRELFKKLAVGVPCAFFLLLLVNFFVFTNLNTGNTTMSAALGQHQYQLSRLSELSSRLESQQLLYQSVGLGKQSFFSYYADRLAASIKDKSISLSSMEVHPLKETKNRSLLFEQDKIKIEGFCNTPLKLNNWLEALEKEDWVVRISNRRYLTRQQDQQGTFSFELEVKKPW